MPGDASGRTSYGAQPFRLECADGSVATLSPMAGDDAEVLGAAFAGMEPWLGYRVPPGRLAVFLGSSEPGCVRFAIRHEGALAGAIVIRDPWLLGPYLQFLGLLPGQQGRGLGRAVLAWMEREAPREARNLWLCVTASNVRARAFYERAGFELVSTLPDLVADGTDELLMRRRLRS